MNKRAFLKLSTAAAAGAMLSPVLSCTPEKKSEPMNLKNWAGNLTYRASEVHEPASRAEVIETVLGHEKIRVLGTRHCFNTIADTDATLLSTAQLNKVIAIDKENKTVTVEAGIRYGEFCQRLHEAGFAIHNLASLPHISVAGACATATHGSGVANGNLATNISAMELVKANGEVVTISRENNPEIFYGSVVGLGSLGVVTKLTLDIVPTFNVRQDVYLNLPFSELQKNFAAIMSAGYSVSLFYDWQTDSINQVWRKSVVTKGVEKTIGTEFFGAKLADRNVHPIIEITAENCTEQMGVPGPWYERLPHFKMGFTPSSGEELQAEYFVNRDVAVDVIKAVATLREEIKPYILITEIRSIAADQFWMSPCYGAPSIAIHFTLKQDIEGVGKLLPKIEEKLAPFNARPHWGKLFTIEPKVLQSRYAKIEDFKRLINEFDPQAKFRNEFVDKNLFNG